MKNEELKGVEEHKTQMKNERIKNERRRRLGGWLSIKASTNVANETGKRPLKPEKDL